MRLKISAAILLSVLTGALGQASAQTSATRTIKIGLLPIINVAPIFVGQEKGFFRDEGLTIDTKTFQGGAAITTAVISGDVDIGFSNVATQVIAHVQGAPVRIVATNDVSSSRAIIDEIYVKANSPIKSLRELTGKRVAINALRGLPDLLLRASIDTDGGDSGKVTFVEIPYPQMGQVLAAGQVDAAYPSEPFKIIVSGDGTRAVGNPRRLIEGAPYGIWVASLSKIASDKDALVRFQRALAKSIEYSVANPEEVRRVASSFTRINPDVLGRMQLPAWNASVDMPGLQNIIALMQKYEFIRKPIKAEETLM